jgi:hypothetical protein
MQQRLMKRVVKETRNAVRGIQLIKRTKIVTGSICTQPIVMALSNYQVTCSANKSIYWCGDYNYCGDTLVLIVRINLFCTD